MIATKRHLWLSLSRMADKDRASLLNTQVASSGLFDIAVQSVVKRFQEAKKQSTAFQRYRDLVPKPPRFPQGDTTLSLPPLVLQGVGSPTGPRPRWSLRKWYNPTVSPTRGLGTASSQPQGVGSSTSAGPRYTGNLPSRLCVSVDASA